MQARRNNIITKCHEVLRMHLLCGTPLPRPPMSHALFGPPCIDLSAVTIDSCSELGSLSKRQVSQNVLPAALQQLGFEAKRHHLNPI